MVGSIQAASSLGKKHRSNLLLLFILAMAKYPSAVRRLGTSLGKLPAKFTVMQLQQVLEKFVKTWAAMNNTELVQEEMARFDEQRQAPIMGVPRMLQKLGLLKKVVNTAASSAKLKRKRESPREPKFFWDMGSQHWDTSTQTRQQSFELLITYWVKRL